MNYVEKARKYEQEMLARRAAQDRKAGRTEPANAKSNPEAIAKAAREARNWRNK